MFANKATSLAAGRSSDAAAASPASVVSLFPQRHAWLWAALPATAATVHVVNDRGLAEAVRMAGFELADRGSADVIILTGGPDPDPGETAEPLSRSDDDDTAAVAVLVDRALDRRSRAGAVRRAAARLGSALVAVPAARERRRIERRLEARGRRVTSLPMSDRARSTYQLGGPSVAARRGSGRGDRPGNPRSRAHVRRGGGGGGLDRDRAGAGHLRDDGR